MSNVVKDEKYQATSRNIVTIFFELDHEIVISQRTVKDAVTLFGDIGGFSGFLLACLALVVGPIPGKSLEISKAENLFRTKIVK